MILKKVLEGQEKNLPGETEKPEKGKKLGRDLLPKEINLLFKKEVSSSWEQARKVVKISAFVTSLIFLLGAGGVFGYYWYLSSYGASLEKRALQAKTEIASYKKEEETYLRLLNKLKDAQNILDSRLSVPSLLERIDSILPLEALPQSLQVAKDGQVSVAITCPSLAVIGNLNENIKEAINQGFLSEAEIRGLTKEATFYKLNLNFKISSLRSFFRGCKTEKIET